MPRVPPRLTEATIKAASKEGKPIQLSDGAVIGLRVRIAASGRVTYAMAWKDQFGGSHKASVPATNLHTARKVAQEMREKIIAGVDIQEERRIRRTATASGATLAVVLDTYATKGHGAQKRSWMLLDQSIRRVFKPHLDKPYQALTVRSLQHTVDQHPGKQSCAHAVRAIRPVLKWAARHIDRFPSELWKIEPPPSNAPRKRVLSDAELKALVPVLCDQSGVHGRCCLFMLLTLARVSEATGARWKDVADGVWTIPQTKSDQEHQVPLSPQALLVMGDRGAHDDLLFPSERGTRLGNWHRQTQIIQARAGVTGWQRHDLRRTGATMLAKLGYPPHVVESALGHVHVHTPLASIYSRVRYLPEVKKALHQLGWMVMPLPQGESKDVDRWGRLEVEYEEGNTA